MKTKHYKHLLFFWFGWLAVITGGVIVDYNHKKEMLQLEKEKIMLEIELHKIRLKKPKDIN